MKKNISALVDGELDARELRELCISMRHDEALRRACSTYVLIGDALRGEPHLATEISGAVLDRLADEPVVLAPHRVAGPWRGRGEWRRPMLALAATLAGVALVAWVGLPSQSIQQALQLTQQGHKVTVSPSDAHMQEYLIAHQIHSGGIYLSGETQRIRTVSLGGLESRR